MFNYIKGSVKNITKDSITFESNNIGFKITAPNPYSYKIDEVCTIYVYLHAKDDVFTLFGFKDDEEKNLFLKLISVTGIGPKSAIAILATGSVSNIVQAINNGDAKYLCKFPGIGNKSAQQIILDLKGKVTAGAYHGNYLVLDEVHDALQVLGYNDSVINKILPQLDSTKDVNALIKDALAIILK